MEVRGLLSLIRDAASGSKYLHHDIKPLLYPELQAACSVADRERPAYLEQRESPAYNFPSKQNLPSVDAAKFSHGPRRTRERPETPPSLAASPRGLCITGERLVMQVRFAAVGKVSRFKKIALRPG